jgi:hypothetical protein
MAVAQGRAVHHARACSPLGSQVWPLEHPTWCRRETACSPRRRAGAPPPRTAPVGWRAGGRVRHLPACQQLDHTLNAHAERARARGGGARAGGSSRCAGEAGEAAGAAAVRAHAGARAHTLVRAARRIDAQQGRVGPPVVQRGDRLEALRAGSVPQCQLHLLASACTHPGISSY